MVQIRNVPDDRHAELEVRAAKAGASLSQYLSGELERIASRPTVAEVLDRAAARGGVKLGPDQAAEVIRALRGPLP